MAAMEYKQIFSHELLFTVPPLQEGIRTEIVILLIHYLNIMRVVSHRVPLRSQSEKAVRGTAFVFQSCNTVLKTKQGLSAIEGSAYNDTSYILMQV